MSESEPDKKGPRFRGDNEKYKLLVPMALQSVSEGSSCRFRDSLRHHREHPEKSSSHVSVQKKDYIS